MEEKRGDAAVGEQPHGQRQWPSVSDSEDFFSRKAVTNLRPYELRLRIDAAGMYTKSDVNRERVNTQRR